MVTLLRALEQSPDRTRPVHVLHAARNSRMLALWPEVQTIVDRLARAASLLCLRQMHEAEHATAMVRQGFPGASSFDGMPVRVAGLTLAANCRAGACGACRQTLRHGTVAHLTEPPFPIGPHEVLTWCAVPTHNVVIDA